MVREGEKGWGGAAERERESEVDVACIPSIISKVTFERDYRAR